jgi:hypothetical protein
MRFRHDYFDDVDFSRDELTWINNALNEVLNGAYSIPEWEFHTLLEGTRDEIHALLERVHDEVSAMGRADPQT